MTREERNAYCREYRAKRKAGTSKMHCNSSIEVAE